MADISEVKSMFIAVFALSLLGGIQQKVHTEDIAQKCLEIAPDRFKWERYNYPDKELVRKALFHASEERNGRLVAGRSGIEQRGKSRDGWQVTPTGAAWLRENEFMLTNVTTSIHGVVSKREADRFLKKIRSEIAFRVFVEQGNLSDVSPYMFTDLLNCSPDASMDTIRFKFDRLLSFAELVNDSDVIKFLTLCRERFAGLLG
ncbi:MAG: hypothetical protein ABSG90_07120 [Dehalococcoidia bacterium]|jgi:hypothetical protein